MWDDGVIVRKWAPHSLHDHRLYTLQFKLLRHLSLKRLLMSDNMTISRSSNMDMETKQIISTVNMNISSILIIIYIPHFTLQLYFLFIFFPLHWHSMNLQFMRHFLCFITTYCCEKQNYNIWGLFIYTAMSTNMLNLNGIPLYEKQLLFHNWHERPTIFKTWII